MVGFVGPGLLVAVGYMDPGNWATDIEAGSRFGHDLLFVVGLSSLAALLLQTLALRVGLVTGQDLAQLCRGRYRPAIANGLWLLAEVGIVACDLAEVLGCALALNLLFGMSIAVGVCVTAFDTLLIVGLKQRGLKRLESIVLGLIATIVVCFLVELAMLGPDWPAIAAGLTPRWSALAQPDAAYLAVGIIGATVMPHNLYLHSAVVKRHRGAAAGLSFTRVLRYFTLDAVVALAVAMAINAALMILAAEAFHRPGRPVVTDLREAYHLLGPIAGTSAASLLFGIALLAAGQSSTFTGTLAGQVVMEGFSDIRLAPWKQRLATRALALLPALAGVLWLGEQSVGRMLVASQVVLSLQLPFAVLPLIRFAGDRGLMGDHAAGRASKAASWFVFAVLLAANGWMLVALVR